VNLVHQDLEAPVHDLVDFLGVEFLGNEGVVGNVSEEHRYELPLALDGTAGREDLIGQVFGCVGLRLGVVNRRSYFGLPQIVAATLAELAARQVCSPTSRTLNFELAAALITKSSVLLVLKLALRAIHPCTSPRKIGRRSLGGSLSEVFYNLERRGRGVKDYFFLVSSESRWRNQPYPIES
jgi:hypothetical protein